MLGWIIYNEKDYKRNSSFANMLIEEGKRNNIQFEVKIVENISFGVDSDKNTLSIIYNEKDCILPDFVISRTIYSLLSRQFELMGIPVFNNSKISSICNDKAKTYQYVASAGIKTIPTTFIKREYISSYIRNGKLHEGHVIKIVDGHGGSEVFLLEKDNQSKIFEYLLEEKKDIVYQKMINGLGCDLRVYVVDNKVVASVLRTSKGGFKSNFSLGGDVRLYDLNSEQLEVVKRVIQTFYNFCPYGESTRGCSFVGIDFILDEKEELVFNEIEDVVGSRMLYKTSEIDIVKVFVESILKKIA